MDKQNIVETINKMNDKQKAKILNELLAEFGNNDTSDGFGNVVENTLSSAIRWLI